VVVRKCSLYITVRASTGTVRISISLSGSKVVRSCGGKGGQKGVLREFTLAQRDIGNLSLTVDQRFKKEMFASERKSVFGCKDL